MDFILKVIKIHMCYLQIVMVIIIMNCMPVISMYGNKIQGLVMASVLGSGPVQPLAHLESYLL